MKILYEDRDIVAVSKPAGVLSELTGNKQSVPLLLKEYFEGRGHKSEIFTVHRLDRDVAGVMVLARTQKAASNLSVQIANRKVTKKYLAVIKGVPEKTEDTLNDLLFRDASKGKTFVVDRMRKGVRDASLAYKVLSSAEGYSLVEIELFTGRTHQIRVQFAFRSLPLYGDGRYGSGDGGHTPALYCKEMTSLHPYTGKETKIEDLPDFSLYPWSIFEDMFNS